MNQSSAPSPSVAPVLGHLQPQEAWDFLQRTPNAVLIDVRMSIESMYVGRPPGAINIPWYEFPDFEPNPSAFVAAVEHEGLSKDQPLILLCRSGARTLTAGKLLLEHGFTKVMHVVHGFEGELDAHHHRSTVSGWRHAGLPWEQM